MPSGASLTRSKFHKVKSLRFQEIDIEHHFAAGQVGVGDHQPHRTRWGAHERMLVLSVRPDLLALYPLANGCPRRIRFRFYAVCGHSIGEIAGSLMRKADDHD
jgi:hypothetical protein